MTGLGQHCCLQLPSASIVGIMVCMYIHVVGVCKQSMATMHNCWARPEQLLASPRAGCEWYLIVTPLGSWRPIRVGSIQSHHPPPPTQQEGLTNYQPSHKIKTHTHTQAHSQMHAPTESTHTHDHNQHSLREECACICCQRSTFGHKIYQ